MGKQFLRTRIENIWRCTSRPLDRNRGDLFRRHVDHPPAAIRQSRAVERLQEIVADGVDPRVAVHLDVDLALVRVPQWTTAIGRETRRSVRA